MDIIAYKESFESFPALGTPPTVCALAKAKLGTFFFFQLPLLTRLSQKGLRHFSLHRSNHDGNYYHGDTRSYKFIISVHIL
ncbi:hypothetical protein V6N13_046338 [Hibiscus sabdariffa]|uniref:Uncharacterized protein n=1 Tax=Hibiscus sabdariffa TaxID=183260 RepID=A0ABR2DA71_9ROSI